MAASYASHSWAALWQTVSRTDRRSVRERVTMPRISLVVLCWSCASCSSRVSRATSISPTDSGALRRSGVAAFRRRDLTDAEPALERRRIAHPKGLGLRRFSKWHYSRDLRSAKWVSIKLRCKIPELRMSVVWTAPWQELSD